MNSPAKNSPTTAPTLHAVSLPALAVFLLSGALEQPGWATTSRDHGEAFRLLESIIPELKQPDEIAGVRTQREARQKDAAWCTAPHAFEITERQRDTIKKCLTALRDKAAMPTGWASQVLLVAFGLADE